MGKRRGPSMQAEILAALKRIELWRKTRKKRRPMPEGLWEEAATLARIHGVQTISRALRLNYSNLKQRLSQMPQQGHEKERQPPSGFVEIRGADLAGGFGIPGSVVELSDGDGRQLTIHLSCHDKLEMAELVQAFVGLQR